MDKVKILVVANHPEILATMLRLINNNEAWHGAGAGSSEEAIDAFNSNTFSVVLWGVGVDSETEQRLLETFRHINPDVRCVRHFGGGSGLLYSEIHHALAAQ